MVRVGLFVRLQAKAGKEAEVAKFLEGALPGALEERIRAVPGSVSPETMMRERDPRPGLSSSTWRGNPFPAHDEPWTSGWSGAFPPPAIPPWQRREAGMPRSAREG